MLTFFWGRLVCSYLFLSNPDSSACLSVTIAPWYKRLSASHPHLAAMIEAWNIWLNSRTILVRDDLSRIPFYYLRFTTLIRLPLFPISAPALVWKASS
ncbi:hypothetical protein C8R46DRAFT_655786 [Mycena filopes]|nr:hypothetical protein C8R46DRAFT_655786 [Mycena filopes]